MSYHRKHFVSAMLLAMQLRMSAGVHACWRVAFALMLVSCFFVPRSSFAFAETEAVLDAAPEVPPEVPPGGLTAAAPKVGVAPSATIGDDDWGNRGTPEQAEVRIHLNHLEEINEQHQVFAAGFYLWITWKGPASAENPAIPHETKSPHIEFINAASYSREMEATDKLPDGRWRSLMRISGVFINPLSLQDFPFDRQKLTISIEDFALDDSKIVYVPSKQSSSLNPDFTLADWDADGFSVESTSYEYPYLDEATQLKPKFSRYHFQLEISRRVPFYFIRFFIPLAVILIVAYLAFWVNESAEELKVEISLTAMLTAIAFSFSIADLLPRVSYVVFLDRVFLASYVFIAMSLIVCVVANHYHRINEHARCHQIHRLARILFPLVFALVIAASAL